MCSSDQINVGLEEDTLDLVEWVVVGRSKNVEGPYFDKEGKNFFHGGGCKVMEGKENWYGTGHNSAYTLNNEDNMFFHVYNAKDGTKPKLKVKTVTWD